MNNSNNFFQLVAEFQQNINWLNQVLKGGETTTVVIDGEAKPSISKDIADRWAAISAMVQGRAAYETKADLPSSPPSGVVLAEVWRDVIVENNGLYGWTGSAWEKSPYDFMDGGYRIATRALATAEGMQAVPSYPNLYDDPLHMNPEKYWPKSGMFEVVEVSGRRCVRLLANTASFNKTFVPDDFKSGRLSVSLRVEQKSQGTPGSGDCVIYLIQYSTPPDREPAGSDELTREEHRFDYDSINEPLTIHFSDVAILSETQQMRLYHRTSDGSNVDISEVLIADGPFAGYRPNYFFHQPYEVTFDSLSAKTSYGQPLLLDNRSGPTEIQEREGAWRNRHNGEAVGRRGVKAEFASAVYYYHGQFGVETLGGELYKWTAAIGEHTLKSYELGAHIKPAFRMDFMDSPEALSAMRYGFDTQPIATKDFYVKLPLASGGVPPYEGFVCTGLDRDADGYWIVGNDGRGGGGSSRLASVVVLSHDFTTVMRDYPFPDDVLPGIGSIQGVAWDSTDDTIWFADKSNNIIRHMDRDGNLLGDEIVLTFPPNGIAYDPGRDGIWAAEEGVTKAYLFSCTNGTKIREVAMRSDADQLFYDSKTQILYCSRGSNGTTGRVYGIDVELEQSVQVSDFELPGSEAIEGIYIDGDKLWCVNDGGFHPEMNPPLNMAIQYTVKDLPKRLHSDVLGVSVVYRKTQTIASASALVSNGDPLSSTDGGWGLFLSNDPDHKLRFILMDNGAYDSQVIIDFDVDSGDREWHSFTASLNRVNGEIAARLDGVTVVASRITGDLTALARKFELERSTVSASGRSAVTRRFNGNIAAVGVFYDSTEIDAIHEYQNKLYMEGVIRESD